MAKIAAPVEQALARRAETGGAGTPRAHVLSRGEGWMVSDVVCASGPHDRPYEEEHSRFSIAIVAAGAFRYRAALGCELMTPGSLLLGSAGQRYECGHEYGAGDRCIAFSYDAEYFANIARDAGMRERSVNFQRLRVPPLASFSSLVARAFAGVTGSADVPWEEMAIQLAARAVQTTGDVAPLSTPRGAAARIARVVQTIERQPDDPRLKLGTLARLAGLSPYHFLRTFERVAGVTPHQYVIRARLREAARRLASEHGRILDLALDCGFGDVSNFNRAFRSEFGATPRQFRAGDGLAAYGNSRR